MAAVSACAALGLAGLASQSLLALETNSPWLTAALGLAAAVLPLWLGSQLWRQSRAGVDQAHRGQRQSSRLQALGRSEELLRPADQVARSGSFDGDPSSGAPHWSDAHFRLVGHVPGAVQPDYAALRARIHPDDLGALEASLQHALRTGGIDAVNHRVCWPDGTLREVLISHDVSARQAAARALATSPDCLRLTLNATGDAVFAFDAAGAHQPLLFVHHRMLPMWDIPSEQAAVPTPAGVMAAANVFFFDPARAHARVVKVIASGTVQEDRLTLNDGRLLLRRCIPTQQAGRQLRVWGFRDITIEARALAGLRTAEAQQRAQLAAFPGYIACISAEPRFAYAQARLAALLGTMPQALTGQPVADAIGSNWSPSGSSSAPRLSRRIARVLGAALLSFEQVHRATRTRPEVHVLVTLARGLDGHNGQTQCDAFGIDITALKHTEAALLAAKNEAELGNHAKLAFLNHMSHELRTPLHAVLGFARLLYDGAQPPLAPQQRAQLGELLQAGQDLMSLRNGLFELARNQGAGAPPPPPSPPPLAAPLSALAPQTPAAADPLTDQEGLPLRVLYIDDNPVNILLMAAMFERLPGLLLRCETDPHQGLALALTDPPALLLVDIQMPGLDGYQLLQRVRADPVACGVPAIAVSANAMPQDLARGRAAGFVDYLTKPLDLQRLQAALQAVLPGWSAPG